MMGMTEMAVSESIDSKVMAEHCANQMKSSIMNEQEEPTNPCCEKQCSCFVNGCSTVAGLNAFISAAAIYSHSVKISSLLSPLTSQQLTSLYRPPILS